MILALLGSIKLALARQLQVGENRIGGLLFALNLALIPMMLLAGVLLDHLGFRVVLIVGSLIISAALFVLSLTPSYQRAYAALLMAGMGLAAVATATVVLMPLAFFDNSKYLTRSLNLGHVFIALGALTTPVIADLFLRTLGYRRTVIVLALLSLVPAFLCILPVFGEAVASQNHDVVGQTFSLWTDHRAWHLFLAGLVFLFYAPLEGALGIWSTTLLTEAGYTESRANLLLSGFWTTFLSSRLLVAIIPFTQRWDPWLLVIPALLSAAVLGNLAGSVGKAPARNGLLLAGFLLGPIFPTLISMVFREYPEDRGISYGAIYAIGSLGSLVVSPLLGLRVKEGTNKAHIAMRISMLLALLMGGTCLIFGLTRPHN
jgi:MFS family permease